MRRNAWLLTLVILTPRASAQLNANVTVNAGSGSGAIPAQAFGLNTAVWDGLLLDPPVPNLLKQAGVNFLRFPGGSTSDVYHWQTHSATAGTGAYVNPNDTFDAFMGVLKSAGAQAVITVNYGSNPQGTAGADPAEAAGWVQYANITKGYGVKYWEIGNEIYGNGEYGAAWEEDLHADHSPTAYGNNVVQFANQMKAVDPTIKVGVVLTTPGNWPDGITPDWNSNVLAACGSKIDFVILHWYPQGPGNESDSGLLSSTAAIAGMVNPVKNLINQYCGANAPNVQILVTEMNSVYSNPGKQSVGLVNALFLADGVMNWLENGVTSVDWWDLHNGITLGNTSASLYGNARFGDYGILSAGNSSNGISEPAAETPFAPFYGLQMLSDLGRPGDQMVGAVSNQTLVSAHAVKQANGNLALLLINKDPTNAYTVSVTLNGYSPNSNATLYNYGKNSASVSANGISGIGPTFSQTIQPYSLNTIVMTGNGSSIAFTSTATATPSSIGLNQSSTITANVKCTAGSLSNGIVDVEIFDPSGTRVAQKFWTSQNFALNQTRQYSYTWRSGSTAGAFAVKVGVFGANWSPNYYWNGGAATITVSGGDTAQYNFEQSSQSWAGSGGMISSVARSTTKSFAGAASLAVNFNGAAAGTQQAFVGSPATPAGKPVTFHVWFPAGSKITAIQPFVQQGAGGNWTWTGNWQSTSNLAAGAWNTITVTVPANAVTPLYQLGVQFFTNGAWTGTCYIDSVSW